MKTEKKLSTLPEDDATDEMPILDPDRDPRRHSRRRFTKAEKRKIMAHVCKFLFGEREEISDDDKPLQ